MRLAQYLARRYHAALILSGRRPQEARIEAQLEALRAAGASHAEYLAVDVSDEAALTRAAQSLSARCGPLHGVFHCAGIAPSSQDLFASEWRELEAVLTPKRSGTQVLERVLPGLGAELFCSFSSTAALLGDFGAGSYAMANRYQIAHAQLERADAIERVAISWPLWRDGGMSGAPEQAAGYLRSSGQRYLETDEAWQALEQILAGGHRHVAVFAGDPARVRSFVQRAYAPTASAIDAPAPNLKSSAPLAHAIAGKGYRAVWAREPVLQCLKADLRERLGRSSPWHRSAWTRKRSWPSLASSR